MSHRGSDIKRQIQTFVDQADNTKRAVERNLASTQRELEGIAGKKFELIETIAQTQLTSILNGENVRDVTGQIQEVMANREAQHKALEAQMEDAHRMLKQSDVEINTHATLLSEKRALYEAEIAADPQVKAASGACASLSREITRLTTLVDSTQDECRGKLAPFAQSAAFQHLLKRQFGTEHYRGMGIFRLLDGWLARKIDFAQSLHDYDILRNLPAKAEERLDAKIAEHRKVTDELKAMEFQISQKHGVVDAELRMKKAEDRRESRRRQISSLQNTLNQYLSNTDPLLIGLKEQFRDNIAKLSLSTLERMAKSTSSLKDDQAVEAYKDIVSREEALRVQEQTQSVRLREASDAFRRARELRDHFVLRDYDSDNRSFRPSFDVSAFISGFVSGRLSSSDLDTQVRNSSTYNEPPRQSYGGSGSSGSYSSPSPTSSSSDSSWSTTDSF